MATFVKWQHIFVRSEVNSLMKMGRSDPIGGKLFTGVTHLLHFAGFAPWEDQLAKCESNNFYSMEVSLCFHLQALYLNDPDKYSEVLVP